MKRVFATRGFASRVFLPAALSGNVTTVATPFISKRHKVSGLSLNRGQLIGSNSARRVLHGTSNSRGSLVGE